MTPGTFDFDIVRGSAFGPLLLYAQDSNGVAVPLTGWTAFSQARNNIGQKIDLMPVITNVTTGEITIQFDQNQTLNFRSGDQAYDLIFRNNGGQIIGPFLTGIVHVKDKVTPSP